MINVTEKILEIERMPMASLLDKYAELYGERTPSRNRTHLVRKIAWRVQALAYGDLTERARKRAAELAKDADVRVAPPRSVKYATTPGITTVAPMPHDPRVPPVGTAIQREYRGQRIRVVVLADGFEFNGQYHRTLTSVARAVTGSHINGFRFFRLDVKTTGGTRE